MQTPVDQLIPHIQPLFKLQCANCPRFSTKSGEVSTAIIAQRFYQEGWRVKKGEVACSDCAAER